MLEETGTVVRTSKGQVRVRINRTEKCAGCHGCALAEGGNYLVVEAVDPFGAAVGDQVLIHSKEISAAKSGLILYIIPLISLLLGYIIGARLVSLLGSSHTEEWGIVSALLFMASSYGVIYLIQRRVVKKHSLYMRVAKILNRAGPEIHSDVDRNPVSEPH